MDEARMIEAIEEDPAGADGQALLAAMDAELNELYRHLPGSLDSYPVRPEELQPPDGSFVVLRAGARALACGGVKRYDAATAEIKRMFVEPAERGRGVARRLLAELEGRAMALGYSTVRLDTGPDQPAARRLYESAGYRSIPAYNENPYAAFWFEKKLSR